MFSVWSCSMMWWRVVRSEGGMVVLWGMKEIGMVMVGMLVGGVGCRSGFGLSVLLVLDLEFGDVVMYCR